MSLDIRKRLFIILFGVLLLIFIIVFLLIRGKKEPEIPKETVQNQEVPAETVTPRAFLLPPVSAPATKEEKQKLLADQIARIFVERFSSYSNQNDNSHIDDVQNLVTSRMFGYLKLQEQPFERSYKGVTTKVVSTSVEVKSETEASVKIAVQMVTEEFQKPSQTLYKNGEVKLLSENGSWKVDGLFWE